MKSTPPRGVIDDVELRAVPQCVEGVVQIHVVARAGKLLDEPRELLAGGENDDVDVSGRTRNPVDGARIGAGEHVRHIGRVKRRSEPCEEVLNRHLLPGRGP